MTDERLPLVQQFHSGTGAYAVDDRYPKYLLPTPSGATGLPDLLTEWQVFFPGVLYVCGRFRDGLWADLDHRLRPIELNLSLNCYPHPIADGLTTKSGDRGWNHTLFAVPLDVWPAVLDFLCEMNLTFSRTGQVSCFGQHDIHIPDPIAAARLGAGVTPPRVLIPAFGVMTESYTAAMGDTLGRPSLVFGPPTAKLVELAAMLPKHGDLTDIAQHSISAEGT